MKIGSLLDVDLTGTRNTLGTLSTLFGCAAGGTNTRNAQHCQRGFKVRFDSTGFLLYHNIGIKGNQHAIRNGKRATLSDRFSLQAFFHQP